MSSLNSSNGSTGAYGTAPARQHTPTRQVFTETPIAPKHTGYGLPCSNCKTYYAANLPACPICKNPQRVSALEPLAAVIPAEQLPDPEQLEKERERFLKEFNSQVVVSPLPPESSAPAQHCTHIENHTSEPEPASICQDCYDRLQERADVLEAALHIELAEAAQIIYDAVWADPSDPSKTYQNAALALLAELRRRSGIPQVFGPLQPGMN
jgi:hypothetical protein